MLLAGWRLCAGRTLDSIRRNAFRAADASDASILRIFDSSRVTVGACGSTVKDAERSSDVDQVILGLEHLEPTLQVVRKCGAMIERVGVDPDALRACLPGPLHRIRQ
jgi:hypothetical protein